MFLQGGGGGGGAQTRNRSLATRILLLISVASWFNTAEAQNVTAPIIPVADCIATLERNDRNGNGRINHVEFMNFLVQLNHPYKNNNNNDSSNNCPSLANLRDFLPDGIYYTLFLQSSCTCLNHDVDQTCCLTPSVRLNTDGKYEDGYYNDICTLVSDKIQQECTPEISTASAPTAMVIARKSPSPSPVRGASITESTLAPTSNVVAKNTTNTTNTTNAPTTNTTIATNTNTTNGTSTSPLPPQQQPDDLVSKDLDTETDNVDDSSSNKGEWKIFLFIPILLVLSGLLLLAGYRNKKKKKKQAAAAALENKKTSDPESLQQQQDDSDDDYYYAVDKSGLPPPPPPPYPPAPPSCVDAAETGEDSSSSNLDKYQYDLPGHVSKGAGGDNENDGAVENTASATDDDDDTEDETDCEQNDVAYIFQGSALSADNVLPEEEDEDVEDSENLHIFVDGSK